MITNKLLNEEVKTFPNPFRDELSIAYTEGFGSGVLHIELTNQVGQKVLVQEFEVQLGDNYIHLGDLTMPSGLYTLNLLKEGSQTISKKVVRIE